MQLPFGKRVIIGGFYVLKHVKALSKKDLKRLRQQQEIPEEVQKHLQRGVLPYITIGTVSGSWSVEWSMGMTIYNAIDEVPVAVDAANVPTYYGSGYTNLGNLINGWFAYTSTVGDEEYQAAVIKAMQDYINRMAEKNKKPLSKEENEKVIKELEDTEKHKGVLIKMADEIKNGDRNEHD